MAKVMHTSRRTILKATGLGAILGLTGGCDAVGGVFGRMFAVPPRETTYFTNNSKFYVVNYADQVESNDVVFEDRGVKVVVDRASLGYIDGTEVDFVKQGLNEAFRFRNPNVKGECGCGESFTV